MKRLILVLPFLLAACGPMAVDQAERQCLDRALLAKKPQTTGFIGLSNRGPQASLSVQVSSDYISGRDPSAVYESCVYQKSGQPPLRPLYTFPEWRG